MSSLNIPQMIAAFIFGSATVTGLFSIFNKKVESPEAKTDLARLVHETAHQLIVDAKSEREELRLTIRELNASIVTKDETIQRLEKLAEEKDAVIAELEARQIRLARKITAGIQITLRDVFGDIIPPDYDITYQGETP